MGKHRLHTKRSSNKDKTDKDSPSKRVSRRQELKRQSRRRRDDASPDEESAEATLRKKAAKLEHERQERLSSRQKILDSCSSFPTIADIPELERVKYAMLEISSGKYKNVAAAAAYWQVRAGKLYRRKSGVCKQDRRGSPSTLSAEDETKLANWMVAMGRQGFEVTPGMVRDAGMMLFPKEGNPFASGRPSGRWLQCFLGRNFNLKKIEQSQVSLLCDAPLSKAVIGEWFAALHSFLSDHGLLDKPGCLWNYGETAVPLHVSIGSTVSPKPDMHVAVSVAMGISAAGQVLPPYIIYRGLNQLPRKWNPLAGAPCGSRKHIFPMNRKSDKVLEDWLEKHLIPNTDGSRPIVVFLCCPSKEMTYKIFQTAYERGIYFVRLPANAKSLVQPLDIEEGGETSFRTRWLRQLMEDNMHIPITFRNVAELIGNAWREAENSEVVKECFTWSGLFPFDPDVINDHDLPSGDLHTLQCEMTSRALLTTGPDKSGAQQCPLAGNHNRVGPRSCQLQDSDISRLLLERLESKLDAHTKSVFRTCQERLLEAEGTPLYQLWKELRDEAQGTGSPSVPAPTELVPPDHNYSFAREEVVTTCSSPGSELQRDSAPGSPGGDPIIGETRCPLCDEICSDDGEEWALCNGQCQRWFHVSCVPAELITPLILEDKAFYCPLCVTCLMESSDV